MTEKERIDKVMQLEGMNSAVFAAAIGIQGSTLSHILNGRNNPSLSVMQSILNRFPNINPDWLILGQGPIEKSTKQSQAPSLFDSIEENDSKSVRYAEKKEDILQSNYSPIQQKISADQEIPVSTINEQTQRVQIPPVIPEAELKQKSVRKIIVYYTDNTFQEFEAH